MKNTYRTRTDIRDGKYVKIVESVKKRDTDRGNRNNNAISKENRTGSNIVVPIWKKAALTIEEAAQYSNIGICKLNELAKKPNCSFVLYVGKKKLIKREKFEKYLSDIIEI